MSTTQRRRCTRGYLVPVSVWDWMGTWDPPTPRLRPLEDGGTRVMIHRLGREIIAHAPPGPPSTLTARCEDVLVGALQLAHRVHGGK